MHPAKAGWHGTYRSSPNSTAGPPLLLTYDGFMDAATYEAGFAHIINTYMVLPNYLRIDTPNAGRNADGSVKKCPLFSFYQAEYIVQGTGSLQNAQQALAKFRSMAAANPKVRLRRVVS